MKFKRRFRRKFKYNKKRSFMFIFFFLLCLSFGLGYSLIQTDINIFGTTVLKDNRWDVHFDNIQEGEDSVSPTVEPEITDNTTVTFSAKLKDPGDKYEFLIDVVNAGTIDAKIGSITLSPELTAEQQNYFSYEVKYESDLELVENQALDAGTTETLKITFKYLEQEDNSLYPGDDQTFNVTLTIDYVQGSGTPVNHQYLYDVLREEAESGGLARKYTGAHHDSFTEEPSKDIYHWYADNDTDGTAVLNKNNVIFANHCWQMIRTTDTGGVKMIYNGEAESGQCLNTRGNHVGYVGALTYDLNNNYWYGTDYTYDKTTNLFSICGTTEQSAWNMTTAPNLIGKYTCKSTSEDGTCSTLYLIESYDNSTLGYAIPLKNYSNYYHFGKLAFNKKSSSPAYVGYMYNTVYNRDSKGMTTNEYMYSNPSLSTNYWYSDSISYDSATGKYSLNNPYKITSTSDYPSLVGKYTLFSSTQTYTFSKAFYIAAVNNTKMYNIELSDFGNHTLSDFNYSYTYGDSYTDNGNGTYTINNPTTIYRSDWYTSYSNLAPNKYVCKNAVNNTCSDLLYTTDSSETTMTYISTSNNYKYSKGFTWDGSKYVLNNDTSISFWNIADNTNKTSLNNAHYTCWNETGECTSVSYIFLLQDILPYYINLTNGKSIDDAKNEMLYNNDVNLKDSTMKIGVDAWYKHYLLDYDDYLEETIYCNDRSQKSANTNGWNPNGGMLDEALQFKEYTLTSDLSCTNTTDQFSVSNNNAKLTYKVGLMSSPEMNLLNNKKIRKTGVDYWLMSPSYFGINSGTSYGRITYSDGIMTYTSIDNSEGVRPAISLKPKTKYLSGDGSMENPYRINSLYD